MRKSHNIFTFILSFFIMATGVIKAIERFRQKGFGFITPAQGGEDIFFHFSGVTGGNEGYVQLREGDTVSYELATGRDGKTKAVKVTVTSQAGEAGEKNVPYTPEDQFGHQDAANDDDFGSAKTHKRDTFSSHQAANDDDFDEREAA
jgi:CspA family cold shock protein